MANSVAPGPRAVTTPEASDPRMAGSSIPAHEPSARLWAFTGFVPAAYTCTRSSPSPGTGRGTRHKSRTSGPPKDRITAAYISAVSDVALIIGSILAFLDRQPKRALR